MDSQSLQVTWNETEQSVLQMPTRRLRCESFPRQHVPAESVAQHREYARAKVVTTLR